MSHELTISSTASLIADPTRAAMLAALLDGRARPAGELAYAAGVTPQTASSHLSKLLAGGVIKVEKEGRHRYYRLAGAHVAEALERLAAIRREEPIRCRPLSPQARRLQFARCCYNHLAGRLGVALTQGLQHRGFIVAAQDKQFRVTPNGVAWFDGLGLDVRALKPTRRGLARQCLDWTERMHHLAGPLGTELLSALCKKGWLRRAEDSRAVRVTPKGWAELQRHFGIDEQSLRSASDV